MPARPEDDVGECAAGTECKNEKAGKKIFRHLGDLLVDRRSGLRRDRLLSDLVESGKHTANSKADRKKKTHCKDSQAGEENCAEGHGASWTEPFQRSDGNTHRQFQRFLGGTCAT